jgi:hypothetical protein
VTAPRSTRWTAARRSGQHPDRDAERHAGARQVGLDGRDPGGYWDHDNDPNTPTQTRWKSLHETVDFIVNTFNNSMNLGMNLFPSKSAKAEYSEAACVVNDAVEVPVGPTNAAAILAAMPGADDTDAQGRHAVGEGRQGGARTS